MEKRMLYIVSMGIFGILFTLVAMAGPFLGVVKFLLEGFGVIVFLGAAVLFYLEWEPKRETGFVDNLKETEASPMEQKRITRVDFLNEEGEVIRTWELYDHVSMLIGRDVGENQVDINLSESPYASMVDIEHAVLNYAYGSWYIEDLGSKNGVVVQKVQDGRKYRLSSERPCKLDKGDVLIIGLCSLQLH